MNILFLGSKSKFNNYLAGINRQRDDKYMLFDKHSPEQFRGMNFHKLIILDGFENEAIDSKDYRNIFPLIRGKNADVSMVKKLSEIEREVNEFRKRLLEPIMTKVQIPCYSCQGGGCPVCNGFGHIDG